MSLSGEGLGDLNVAQDLEAEGYESPNSSNSTPVSIRSPSPTANLSRHPFFREEFALPFEESFEALISQRRMRASTSVRSISPEAAPIVNVRSRGGKKRGRTKLNMAGLVGGDSDSSALTQESGDEGVGTPRGSVVTGTHGGTDHAEDEDVEMREPSHGTLVSMSPNSYLISYTAPSASPKPTRGKPKGAKKATTGRTRTTTAPNTTRPTKKRKR